MQTEDEIAAINMASGAALTGVRAATGTSGPGFSLMAEGLGWAGNNEVPVVVTYYQRGAPSTGLPTRHGQGDLRFAMHASHGEFPRIILSSGDFEECFYDAARAFNYAERYQTPVIHLIDKGLANSNKSYKMFDPSLVKIERGQTLSEQDVEGKEYKRFEFTESGISPRVALGTPGVFFWNTGDEHDSVGNINEESVNRTRMYEKRMKKLELADKEIPVEERVNFFGDSDATTAVVSWGSPKGAVSEAVDRLRQEGFKMCFIQVRMPLPLPRAYIAEKLGQAQKKIIVESNYNAQLAGVIREETGVVMDYFVLKWNGRPMSSDEVYEALRLIMQDKAPKRQVLNNGN
jgi:2-oxoglutarate ferredoxin oxidoreductase subunit alpha